LQHLETDKIKAEELADRQEVASYARDKLNVLKQLFSNIVAPDDEKKDAGGKKITGPLSTSNLPALQIKEERMPALAGGELLLDTFLSIVSTVTSTLKEAEGKDKVAVRCTNFNDFLVSAHVANTDRYPTRRCRSRILHRKKYV
jgi:hypothetical protein